MASRSVRPSSWWILTIGFAALYWIVDLAVLRAGVPHPLDDLWEDGVVARHLLEGHGFRTTVIYPPLWSLRDPATGTVPVMVHGPLLPLALALPLRWAGPQAIDHVAWVAAAFAVVAAALTYRIGARWFGPPVGAAAALLLTLSPVLVDAVHHSLSVVVGAALLLAAFDRAREDRPLAAGLLLGVGALTRPEFRLAIPLLAILAARRGVGRAAWLVVGALAPVGAWAWQAWRATGMPFFNLTSYTLLADTPAHPGRSLLLAFDLTPDRWSALFRAELPDLWSKWLLGAPRALRHGLTALGATLGWLAPVGFWAMARDPASRRAAWVVLALAALPLLLMVLTLPVKLYLLPFLGVDALAAARGAAWLLERSGRTPADPRRFVIGLGAVALLSTAPALVRVAREGRMTARLLASERAALAPLREPSNALLISDRPDFVAWTTGRPTLWLERDAYRRLYPAGGPPGAPRPAGLPAQRDPSITWFHDGHWARGAPDR